MGLDAFLFIVNNETNESEELTCFRKFNALQGFMEDLYREKGGTEEDFNCIPLELTDEDLMELEMRLRHNLLTPREGFFFGAQEVSDYHKEDLRFALEKIKSLKESGADFKVMYDSWW
jgi:hypothetical protein